MTISPWLTFESIKDLQTSVDNLNSSNLYVSIDPDDGDPADAFGPRGVAIGADSEANVFDTAVGFRARATGIQGVALGYEATANAQYGIAIGNDALASASRAIGIGDSVRCRGSFSIAIGEDAGVNTGVSGATVLGQNAFCQSNNATMLGGNTAMGTNSDSAIALGRSAAIGNNAAGAVQIGVGTNSTSNSLQFRTVPIANSTGLVVPGPFADDTAAAGGGVGIGNPYYQPSGALVVRLT